MSCWQTLSSSPLTSNTTFPDDYHVVNILQHLFLIGHDPRSAPSPPPHPSSIPQYYSSLNTRLTPFLPRHILTIPLDCCSSKTLQPRIVPSMNFGCHCTRMPSSFPPKNDVLLNDVLLIFQYSGEGWGNSRLFEMEMNEIYVMTLK